MNSPIATFRKPSAAERVFNQIFGFLVGLGLGFSPQLPLASAGPQEWTLVLHAHLICWSFAVSAFWSLHVAGPSGCATQRRPAK